jgi:hypothetical protein
MMFEDGEYLENHISLFLDNGEIVHFSKENSELLENARDSFEKQSQIDITKLSNNSGQADFISSIDKPADKQAPVVTSTQKEMYNRQSFNSIKFSTRNPLEHAKITKLATYNVAQKVMDGFNGETDEDSQCYNRAHMWSYESLIKHKVSLGKVWIFFTKKYIREYSYKWWFHIAPYTEVAADGQKYILDRGFSLIPYNVTNWKNLFVKSKAECPVITKYTEYSKKQYEADCYLMYSSQYYWQPWQLKSLGRKGYKTWGYKKNDLKITYRNALTKWDGTVLDFDSTPRVQLSEDIVVNEEETVELETTEEEATEEETTVDVTTVEEINEVTETIPSSTNESYSPVNEEVTTDTTRLNTNFYKQLNIGQRVRNTSKGSVLVKIIKKNTNGTYRVLFLEGPNRGKEGDNWDRSDLAVLDGCSSGLCVGNSVINVSRDSALAKIIGIETNGKFVIRFLDGSSKGKKGSNWNRNDFATLSGCSGDLCVDQQVINVSRDSALVKIIGIETNGKFVIRFLDGSSKGKKGSKWDRKDFAVLSGCSGSFCVGQTVLLKSRDVLVTIVAKQTDGNFVIKFLEGRNKGKVGSNWNTKDFSRTN